MHHVKIVNYKKSCIEDGIGCKVKFSCLCYLRSFRLFFFHSSFFCIGFPHCFEFLKSLSWFCSYKQKLSCSFIINFFLSPLTIYYLLESLYGWELIFFHQAYSSNLIKFRLIAFTTWNFVIIHQFIVFVHCQMN